MSENKRVKGFSFRDYLKMKRKGQNPEPRLYFSFKGVFVKWEAENLECVFCVGKIGN